jgi:type II secretory pathway pseudopilin PulG
MKTTFQILLIIVIGFLAFLVYESIMRPVKFQREYNIRTEKVIDRLKDIRSAQAAYKLVNGKYTASFDTLSDFVANGQIPVVRMEGSLNDSMILAGMTELKALELGIIKRDTAYVNVIDTLFKTKTWIADSLRYVPFTDKAEFELGTNVLSTASGVDVEVFEAKVSYEVFLQGLEKQEIINLREVDVKLDRFPGLRVGSLTEANNNAGNWE